MARKISEVKSFKKIKGLNYDKMCEMMLNPNSGSKPLYCASPVIINEGLKLRVTLPNGGTAKRGNRH